MKRQRRRTRTNRRRPEGAARTAGRRAPSREGRSGIDQEVGRSL